jgi:hypothetical protein
LHSHAAIELRRTTFSCGGYVYDNNDPSSRLRMMFHNVTRGGPNGDRTECHWSLEISLENINTEDFKNESEIH